MKKVAKRKFIKSKVKDSVFTNLFKISKYKLELYRALNPKDKNVTEKDIKTITLETILTNNIYNDLGLMVKDTIIFLLEAQSVWSVNILVRELMYLANTYKEYFERLKINLYSTKKVFLPIPKLYVIYTGEKKLSKKEISLNEEYFNNEAPIDIKVKVITLKEKVNNIIMQYIKFSKMIDKIRTTGKDDKRTLEKVINECIKKDILKEYLTEHKKEVVDMLSILYDQNYVTECYEKEIYDEAMQKGREKGREEGREDILNRLIKKGLITKEDAEKELQLM